MLREVQGIPKRVGGRCALRHEGEIQYRKTGHALYYLFQPPDRWGGHKPRGGRAPLHSTISRCSTNFESDCAKALSFRSNVTSLPPCFFASPKRYASVTWRCPVRMPAGIDSFSRVRSSGQNVWPSDAVNWRSKRRASAGETAPGVKAELHESLTKPHCVIGQVAQPVSRFSINH